VRGIREPRRRKVCEASAALVKASAKICGAASLVVSSSFFPSCITLTFPVNLTRPFVQLRFPPQVCAFFLIFSPLFLRPFIQAPMIHELPTSRVAASFLSTRRFTSTYASRNWRLLLSLTTCTPNSIYSPRLSVNISHCLLY
jgi:hypothetical protein